jgi:hydroxyacylglutathione hydrolase
MDLPPHLARNEAQGIVLNESVAQFEIGSQRNFIYLVLDWSRMKASVVDPQADLAPWLPKIQSLGFCLESIFLTHTHADHTAGVPRLVELFPEIKIFVHPLDLHRLPAALRISPNIREIKSGETYAVGDFAVEVMHTPGHSAGECCFLLLTNPPYLFTGDTLFIRDCGRTDLGSGNDVEMFESLQTIKGLSPATRILPGHHYQAECASWLSQEMKISPPLRCTSVEELAALP